MLVCRRSVVRFAAAGTTQMWAVVIQETSESRGRIGALVLLPRHGQDTRAPAHTSSPHAALRLAASAWRTLRPDHRVRRTRCLHFSLMSSVAAGGRGHGLVASHDLLLLARSPVPEQADQCQPLRPHLHHCCDPIDRSNHMSNQWVQVLRPSQPFVPDDSEHGVPGRTRGQAP